MHPATISDAIFINTLRPTQNGRNFADDTFKHIFLNKNVTIPIEISLKFVSTGPINKTQALVQIMAWRRPGVKPLSEPMMVSLPMRICVTRPQWVKANNTRCILLKKPRGAAVNIHLLHMSNVEDIDKCFDDVFFYLQFQLLMDLWDSFNHIFVSCLK